MADETKTPAAPDAAELIKNTKAEFDRKTANLEASNKALSDQIAALTAQLKPAPKAEPAKKVSVFEDEDAFAERISRDTEARIKKDLAAENEKNRKMQVISTQLYADYPELSEKGSALMKRAEELFAALPNEERSPYAMKSAVQDAAQELDLKPFNKRAAKNSDDDDSFQIGSGSGAATANKKPGKNDLSREQETLAELLGIDVSKPEVRARIKEKHGRSSYGRYK